MLGLVDVVGKGSSTATLSGITLGDLLKGKYAIDVDESSADTKRYVARADGFGLARVVDDEICLPRRSTIGRKSLFGVRLVMGYVREEPSV